jgi:hypothetical protein
LHGKNKRPVPVRIVSYDIDDYRVKALGSPSDVGVETPTVNEKDLDDARETQAKKAEGPT